MKFLFISLLIILSQFSESHSKNKLEKKLNSLKKQTVEIHNNIISNNKELKIIKLDILEKLEEKQSGVAHKPANYYKFNKNRYEKYLKSGFFKFEF